MFSSNRPPHCLSLARPFPLRVLRPHHTARFHFLQNAPVWQAHTDISTPMFPNKMAIDKIHFQPQIWLLQGCTVSKCSVIRWHSEELLLMRNTLLLLFPWKINAPMPRQIGRQYSQWRQSQRPRNGKRNQGRRNFGHFNKSQVGSAKSLVKTQHMLGTSVHTGDTAVTRAIPALTELSFS